MPHLYDATVRSTADATEFATSKNVPPEALRDLGARGVVAVKRAHLRHRKDGPPEALRDLGDRGVVAVEHPCIRAINTLVPSNPDRP